MGVAYGKKTSCSFEIPQTEKVEYKIESEITDHLCGVEKLLVAVMQTEIADGMHEQMHQYRRLM